MIETGQAAVSASAIFTRIPPGPASVTLSSGGTVYVGSLATGGSVTTASGYPVTSSPITFHCFPGSTGAALAGIASAGTVTVYWLISTSQ